MYRRIPTLLLVVLAVVPHHGFFTEASDAQEISVYELKLGNVSMKLTNWGATVMSLVLPDKNGKYEDVVLGFDTPDEYKTDKSYFGSIVGRVANRIKNAEFTLNGTNYKLTPNDGPNMLHGGPKGFSDVLWKVNKYFPGGSSPYIVFTYTSNSGEEGFPGKLHVSVSYMLAKHNKYDQLTITMKAKPVNEPTPVNLAHHMYWNLGGHNSGDILSHEVEILGSNYTPVDDHLIPTGEIKPVTGTPYDFHEAHTVREKINELPNGYDINYVLDKHRDHHWLHTAAIVYEPKSGRKMHLLTNQPGLQFYTGGLLKDTKGKGGFVYKVHAGLCLETQLFPDSLHNPNFPSEILDVKKTYHHNMLFRFSSA